MNPQPTMNQLMDVFFTSIANPSTTLRERYFLRESLYSLQRLSMSQHKLDMARSIKKMIHTYPFTHNIKQKKILDAHEDHAAAKNKPSSHHQNP
jgi:hypothetical protein